MEAWASVSVRVPANDEYGSDAESGNTADKYVGIIWRNGREAAMGESELGLATDVELGVSTDV